MQNGGLYVPNTIARVFIVHSSPDGAIGGYNIEKICGCERRGLQRAHLVCSRTPLYSCDMWCSVCRPQDFYWTCTTWKGRKRKQLVKKVTAALQVFFVVEHFSVSICRAARWSRRQAWWICWSSAANWSKCNVYHWPVCVEASCEKIFTCMLIGVKIVFW